MRYEYTKITPRVGFKDSRVNTFYTSEDFEAATSLIDILNEMGESRWEFIGEFDGELIMKRAVQ